jgi:hypothetical protein
MSEYSVTPARPSSSRLPWPETNDFSRQQKFIAELNKANTSE